MRISSPGTGPNVSERLSGFIWADFQTKPSTLDPFGTKCDVFGQDPTLRPET